jgi:histidine triad (HIT) family protein
MTDCIFCKIVNGEVPSDIVYRGAHVTAFRDINPAAPVHILIVPNRHIDDIRDPRAFEDDVLKEMFEAANRVAEQEGIATSGYRLLFNYGPDANLVVPHLHLHLLGGRPLGPMVARR